MSKVPFPSAPVSEITVFRIDTPRGLFGYRHLQALDLLHPPDFEGGDLTGDQRRQVLDRHVSMQKPLCALVIFLNVVALEDLIRELGDRLAALSLIRQNFRNIDQVATKMRRPNPNKPQKRPDEGPFPYLEAAELNQHYRSALGVEPVAASDFARLSDLAILRHTVAHHGSLIRAIDVSRFQFYDVAPGTLINPPPEFVAETSQYLYQIGTRFEATVRQAVFAGLLSTFAPGWETSLPTGLAEVIEAFNFFDILLQEEDLPPFNYALVADAGAHVARRQLSRAILLEKCVAKLVAGSF